MRTMFLVIVLCLTSVSVAKSQERPTYFVGLVCSSEEDATHIATSFAQGGNDAAFEIAREKIEAGLCGVASFDEHLQVVSGVVIARYVHDDLYLHVVRAKIATIHSEVFILPSGRQDILPVRETV